MDTDYGVPGEVDRIQARVSKMMDTGAGLEEVETWRNTFPVSDDALGQPGLYELPATFGVLPGESDVNEAIVIELQALGSGTDQALVSRRVTTGFVAGETRLIRMALYRACAEMVCPERETCGCPGAAACAEPPAARSRRASRGCSGNRRIRGIAAMARPMPIPRATSLSTA